MQDAVEVARLEELRRRGLSRGHRFVNVAIDHKSLGPKRIPGDENCHSYNWYRYFHPFFHVHISLVWKFGRRDRMRCASRQKMQRLLLAWWSLAQCGPTPPRTRRKSSAAINIPRVGARK